MRRFRKWPYLSIVLACAPLAALRAEVSSDTLPNGLKIVVDEDHRIPDVAMYLFFRVGSRNERPGITGISHFFEHMMFNGAKKYGPKQFDIQMEKNGGENNAYTSEDVTVYTDSFPSAALPLMMDMEADRMRDLNFDPKIVASERQVVYSERRSSVDNDPFGMLDEQLVAAAFIAHPYHWPVVGWPSDIESWTMADLEAHYKMGYAPNNCTMVVVGGVTRGAVLDLARRYLSPIPPHDPPPPVRTVEPAQLGERRVTVRKQAQLSLLMVAYHGPSSHDPDDTPVAVLEAVLGRGRSSRLYRRLVERDQLAVNVQVFRQPSLDPGLIQFSIEPRRGIEPARAEQALSEEIERMREANAPGEELGKAKNELLVEHYREMQTIAGRANLLGDYEVFHGGYRNLYGVERDIEAVTAADVQRVASKYLSPPNRTVATLVPSVGSVKP